MEILASHTDLVLDHAHRSAATAAQAYGDVSTQEHRSKDRSVSIHAMVPRVVCVNPRVKTTPCDVYWWPPCTASHTNSV